MWGNEGIPPLTLYLGFRWNRVVRCIGNFLVFGAGVEEMHILLLNVLLTFHQSISV
jgi:hypothetical protein